ncbi:MAG: hypothetical protein KC466_12710, partial [Myxococcales bacterium]|nr:hypothetical protein [Myxococcales bacterium]
AGAIVTRLGGHELWLAGSVRDAAGRAALSDNAPLWAEIGSIGDAIETFVRDHDIPVLDAPRAPGDEGLLALLSDVAGATGRARGGRFAPADDRALGGADAYGPLAIAYWTAVEAYHQERDRLREQTHARRLERLRDRWRAR